MVTPVQGSRVKSHAGSAPAASPFSNCLRQLPTLTPPRPTYGAYGQESSFSHLNAVASPAPAGYGALRFPGISQTPTKGTAPGSDGKGCGGGGADGYDVLSTLGTALGATPVKAGSGSFADIGTTPVKSTGEAPFVSPSRFGGLQARREGRAGAAARRWPRRGSATCHAEGGGRLTLRPSPCLQSPISLFKPSPLRGAAAAPSPASGGRGLPPAPSGAALAQALGSSSKLAAGAGAGAGAGTTVLSSTFATLLDGSSRSSPLASALQAQQQRQQQSQGRPFGGFAGLLGEGSGSLGGAPRSASRGSGELGGADGGGGAPPLSPAAGPAVGAALAPRAPQMQTQQQQQGGGGGSPALFVQGVSPRHAPGEAGPGPAFGAGSRLERRRALQFGGGAASSADGGGGGASSGAAGAGAGAGPSSEELSLGLTGLPGSSGLGTGGEEEEEEVEGEEAIGIGVQRRRQRALEAAAAAAAAAQARAQVAGAPRRRGAGAAAVAAAAAARAAAPAAAAAAAAEEEDTDPTPMVHSMLPASPMCQPLSIERLLPIPKLRSGDERSISPLPRLRMPTAIDSPAVKAATHAAVVAALEATTAAASEAASAGIGRQASGAGGGGIARLPRAASAGAAAASRAAAAAAGVTPAARRPGHKAGRVSSLGPDTPDDDDMPSVVPKAGPKRCNCKKSRCLKLYCDCFANGGYCGAGCTCANCANRANNLKAVLAARESIKARNPNAFTTKARRFLPFFLFLPPLSFPFFIFLPPFSFPSFLIEAGDGTAQHRRGCNCKKSHCMKKYCECFQAGVACGEHCKCESCHNTTASSARRAAAGGAKRSRRSGRARAAAAASTTEDEDEELAAEEQAAAAEAAAAAAAEEAAATAASAAAAAAPMQLLLAAGAGGGAAPVMLPPLHLTPAQLQAAVAAAGGAASAPACQESAATATGVQFSFPVIPALAGLVPAAAAAAAGRSSSPEDAAAAAVAAALQAAPQPGFDPSQLLVPLASLGVPPHADAPPPPMSPPPPKAAGLGDVRATPTKRKPARTMTAALM
eukprot:scaffold23.g4102.t1